MLRCPALLLAFTISLAGCATSTNERTNTPPSQPEVSPSLQQEEAYRGLKRRVAIARFSDETRRGSSFFVDENYDRIGKQASDILASRLSDSGRFLMFERSDLDKVLAEQDYASLEPARVGADYLIVGSVSEFGHSNVSETGIFTRNRIQRATATVNVRLLDTSTGQIVFSEEATGEARAEASTAFGVGERAAFDTALADQAVSAAISQLVSNLIENLMHTPWQAYLVGERDGLYLMTGGQTQGLERGDELSVYERGDKVRNPQTGLNIELPATRLGSLTVVDFIGEGDNELSMVRSELDLSDEQLHDLVVRSN